ncbi:hypothetical protein acdb102_32710 [Acidothermaceae bacterium B102]|nr:hypothetical protein acdb102_32710 [Acidothermaceae bacterium B102]
MMDADEVLDVLDTLADRPTWVVGGWGVDALLGRQSRPHRDLDLLVRAEQLDEVVGSLTALGYVVETDWLPVRVELAGTGGWVDVHPVVFDDAGNGRQDNGAGDYYRYPADDFVTGIIAGRTVGCVSAELQLAVHTGYEPREIDLLDIAVLQDLLA